MAKPEASKTKVIKNHVRRGVSKPIGKAIRRESASKKMPSRCEKDMRSSTVSEKSLPHVLLPGAIPNVLKWARDQLDVERESNGTETEFAAPRSLARRILAKHNVYIILNGVEYWKAEVRLWENVFALSAKLPGKGNASNILEAMCRYPSSILVYRGLKSFFGRYMIIGGKKIPRFSLRQNAFAMFSPHVGEESISKKWFKLNTLSRMQETVIHMSAVSEYILRCAYVCKQMKAEPDHNRGIFIRLLENTIADDHDVKRRRRLCFESGNAYGELSPDNLLPCLEKAINAAQEAVVEGAKLATRKYGHREGKGKQRKKIELWMLQRPLPDIMDALIRRLEGIVCHILGSGVDVDEFRLRAMRHMRKVEDIYREVGDTWFQNETDFNTPPSIPKGTEVLVSSACYTYT